MLCLCVCVSWLYNDPPRLSSVSFIVVWLSDEPSRVPTLSVFEWTDKQKKNGKQGTATPVGNIED